MTTTDPQAGTGTATQDARAHRGPTAERAFAVAQVAAPLTTALAMPALDPQAQATICTFLAAPALVAAANAAGLLPERLLNDVPGGDILRAHRRPFLASALATGFAAAACTLNGTAGTDTLAAGFMTMPSTSGIVSIAWWGTVAYIASSLRRVLTPHRPTAPAGPTPADDAPGPDGELPGPVTDIINRWHTYISNPRGTNPNQDLILTGWGPDAWTGTIRATPGHSVTVTTDTVSGVYQLPHAWITITDGPYGSSKHITVRTTAPTTDEAQHTGLQALWNRRVARSGGCMPGTHLEEITPDPATGGIAAWVVADENTDAITVPDQYRLAGALYSTPLLISIQPTQNPRRAKLRKMEHSPLETGKDLTDPSVLRANKNGFVQIGTGISGRPARLQLFDPKIGAQHILVAGVTGSGKGGILQIIALAYHVNHVAILYGDPKGSSNPDVAKMASYAGTGRAGAMGMLRLAHAILMHRIAQSAAEDAKNFKATPERPFIGVVLDEFAQLLSEKSPDQEEAAPIVAALASMGRSMGMGLVLCGQIMNLDQLGSDTSIRDNVFYGGALVLLRSDSDQKNRVDLPDAFSGIDPSKIPAFWRTGDESLIYDPDVPEDDPTRTFGVGYTVGPDESAEMMRAWILESAAGLYRSDQIVIPADFPGWEDRETIAATPVNTKKKRGSKGATKAAGAADDYDLDGDGDFDDEQTSPDDNAASWAPAPVTALAKEPTAEEKILLVLREYADPIGEEVAYTHIDTIIASAGVARRTVENRLTSLVKSGKVIRGAAGEYGLPLEGYATP
ncbi:hypothetical protein [Kitasatospora cineracea]|uniref:FtsK domain-containing protein n=1 Tax=Kitasatospora cineracea TaxID=88074 RepID=A0A3N4RFY3_9ACTN|nr:hypothetical protein [Kitasatospora cineracea]RPE27307.1 hypothetical protein EDD38_7452 [Kitasatospora cineracea]